VHNVPQHGTALTASELDLAEIRKKSQARVLQFNTARAEKFPAASSEEPKGSSCEPLLVEEGLQRVV